ncbi:hypothetical protein [Marinococcus halophilus]|uniref:hypothetical protein n=1 Tax=Marinococcus halophilus TaxID=1371 RepID=UPI001303D909|nr:hypothetical protein [Marinococcus halophilus]
MKQTLALTSIFAGVSFFGVLILNIFDFESIISIKEHWAEAIESTLKIIGILFIYSIIQYALGNKKCMLPVSGLFLMFCLKNSIYASITVLICVVPSFLMIKFFIEPLDFTMAWLNYTDLISIAAGIGSLSFLITVVKQLPVYYKWSTSGGYE